MNKTSKWFLLVVIVTIYYVVATKLHSKNGLLLGLCCTSLLVLMLISNVFSTVTIYPLPSQVQTTYFTATINGQPAQIFKAWDKYYSLSFDFEGTVEIKITASTPDYWSQGVEVQPWIQCIRPTVSGNTITFSLSNPAKLAIVKPGKYSNPSSGGVVSDDMLFVFASKPEVNQPKQGDSGVRYYGPGYYEENIDLTSGTTLYLHGGAVVKGSINIFNAQNVKILGRGTIIHNDVNTEGIDAPQPNVRAITMYNAQSVTVEGIHIVTQSRTYHVIIGDNSSNITFDNVTEVGACQVNANVDGIHIKRNANNIVINDCFIRAADDIIAIEQNDIVGSPGAISNSIKDVTITNCVLSTSISNIVRVGWSTEVTNSSNFVMRNCDVIHMGLGSCTVPFSLLCNWQSGGSGTNTGYLFENIRLESWYNLLIIDSPYTNWSNIRYKNIWAIEKMTMVPSTVRAASIDTLVFENVEIANKIAASNQDIPLTTQGTVNNIQFVVSDSIPRASFTFSPSAIVPLQQVTFDASGSHDPDGTISSYEWFFGDGTSGSGKVVTHSYSDTTGTLWDNTGKYRVLLKVTDNSGKIVWTSRTVMVVNSFRNPENPTGLTQGLDYKYYEGIWDNIPNFDAMTSVRTGIISQFTVSIPNRRADNYGLVFTGYIDIPVDGGYSFSIVSKEASQLYIGSTLVVSRTTKIPAVCGGNYNVFLEASGNVGLKAGKHFIRVILTERSGPDGLNVRWEGPGLSWQDIPSSALFCSGGSETPGITVTSPNGNETWPTNSNQTVKWTNAGTVGNINIDISTNSGTTWTSLVLNTANDGSQLVTIPNTPSTTCRIRVQEIDGNPTDISDSIFTIAEPDNILPVIKITSPEDNSTVTTSLLTVSGTAFDNVGLKNLEVGTGEIKYEAVAGTLSPWSKSIILTSGLNIVYARVTDTSDNIMVTTITITYVPAATLYSIKGNLQVYKSKSGISEVAMKLNRVSAIEPMADNINGSYTTGEDGYYEFADLGIGNYSVEPVNSNWRFWPNKMEYIGLHSDKEEQNFIGKPLSVTRIVSPQIQISSGMAVTPISENSSVDSEISVLVPKEAFSTTVNLTLTAINAPISDITSTKVVGYGVDILNDKNLQPLKEITITINYDESEIVGYDENKFVVGYYDENNQQWEALPTTVYPSDNKVVGRSSHLSMFALLESVLSAKDLSNVNIYPSPYNPAKHVQGMTIEGLTAGAPVKIYTLGGELARELVESGNSGNVVWDGKNNGGKLVASGVYIIYIEGTTGIKKVKIAIEK
ncbi:MAG: PKD domain-containing protein [Elusimicrobia bacterium]|nr:PKD domain-containing protein [Elusimicrobiota bacterium]